MNNTKNVIITGASRGIGLALAKKLATENYSLFLIANHMASFIDTEINGPSIMKFSADFSALDAIEKLVKQINEATDQIDVLINNLGVYLEKPIHESSKDDFYSLMDINYRGPSYFTQKLLPNLLASKASQIINISSQSAISCPENQSLYSASKSAVTAFSNSLRKEINPLGIRVSVIHPTSVNTWNDPDPKGLLSTEDVANLVHFIIECNTKCQIEEVTLSGV